MIAFKKYLNKLFEKIVQRNSKLLCNALDSLPNYDGIKLIDVGASGDLEPRWKNIASKIHYIGFEPDKRSADLLKKQSTTCKSYTLYPFAVSNCDQNIIKINLCASPQVSSIFKPNKKLINLYPNSERFNITKVVDVPCTTIDSLNLNTVDFIKIDIQGAELNALLGSTKTIKEILGMEIEVEFTEIYESQPLFGDVVRFATSNGFEFIDFINCTRWERQAHNGYGQLIFGDALFLKSPEVFMKCRPSIEKISSYMGILLLYKRYDLISVCLGMLTEEKQRDFLKFKSSIKPLLKIDNTIRYIHKIYH